MDRCNRMSDDEKYRRWRKGRETMSSLIKRLGSEAVIHIGGNVTSGGIEKVNNVVMTNVFGYLC